jgi:histidyl-tRNA synthetase
VLRAIDKLDKFGAEGVRLLLGPGRWDGGKEGKGDFTKGAGLDAAIDTCSRSLEAATANSNHGSRTRAESRGAEGVEELARSAPGHCGRL